MARPLDEADLWAVGLVKDERGLWWDDLEDTGLVGDTFEAFVREAAYPFYPPIGPQRRRGDMTPISKQTEARLARLISDALEEVGYSRLQVGPVYIAEVAPEGHLRFEIAMRFDAATEAERLEERLAALKAVP